MTGDSDPMKRNYSQRYCPCYNARVGCLQSTQWLCVLFRFPLTGASRPVLLFFCSGKKSTAPAETAIITVCRHGKHPRACCSALVTSTCPRKQCQNTTVSFSICAPVKKELVFTRNENYRKVLCLYVVLYRKYFIELV